MHKYNGGGGYLYNRLRYLRKKEKNKCKNNLQTVSETEELDIENEIVASSSQNTTNGDTTTSDSYQMDELLCLKTMVVNQQNIPKIHEILRKTLKRRRELLNTKNVNMLELFPFMFVDPSFVSQLDFFCLIFL